MSAAAVDTLIVVCLAALWGASLGSFACVVVERGWRSIGGRSRCSCGRPLSWWENIPLVAWPALGGRARCCSSSIPVHYWLVEVAFAVIWVVGALVGGLPGMLVAGAVTLALTVLARLLKAVRAAR